MHCGILFLGNYLPMARAERNNGLAPTSLRIMNLYFATPDVRRNKAVSTIGWEALDFLSDIDRAFLGYPHQKPRFGPFTFQAFHEGNSYWVGISSDGKRIRFSEENDKKLIYHEWNTGEGIWTTQDPRQCCGQEALEFDGAFEGLVRIAEKQLGQQEA